RDRQSLGGDVGRSGGGSIGRVVGRIGAAQGDGAHADSFGGANGLAGEDGAGVAGRQVIAGQAVVRQAHRGAGRAVIDLIGASGADRQSAGGDVGGGGGRAGG